jgi:hypothetical protein
VQGAEMKISCRKVYCARGRGSKAKEKKRKEGRIETVAAHMLPQMAFIRIKAICISSY